MVSRRATEEECARLDQLDHLGAVGQFRMNMSCGDWKRQSRLKIKYSTVSGDSQHPREDAIGDKTSRLTESGRGKMAQNGQKENGHSQAAANTYRKRIRIFHSRHRVAKETDDKSGTWPSNHRDPGTR